jgi:tetratricopeptide (TPR) repeat protein
MSIDRIRSLRSQGLHEEALQLAVQLAAAAPADPLLQYEAACVHDYLGREAEAVPYYREAITCGLEGAALTSAYLGLGSSCRALGRYRESVDTFEQGLARFPDAVELKVFRAMALYNTGRAKEAVASLLAVVAQTSDDEAVRGLRRAIELYAEDLDRSW